MKKKEEDKVGEREEIEMKREEDKGGERRLR